MTNVIEVPLSRGLKALVDAEDAWVLNFNWHVSCSSKRPNMLYAVRNIVVAGYKSSEKMHRRIMNAPLDKVVDHINGNTLDNRRSNLRIVTQAVNMQNLAGARSDSRTGVLGVYFIPRLRKYAAQIKVNGKSRHLGTFSTIEEAIEVRLKAEAEFFGIQPRRQEAHNS